MLPLANVAPALCLRNIFSDLEHEEPGNMELGSSEHGNLEARNMEPGHPKHGNLEPGNMMVEPGNTMVEPGTLEAEVSNLDLGHNTQHDLLRFTASPGLTGNHIHLNGETGPCSTLYVKGSTKRPN